MCVFPSAVSVKGPTVHNHSLRRGSRARLLSVPTRRGPSRLYVPVLTPVPGAPPLPGPPAPRDYVPGDGSRRLIFSGWGRGFVPPTCLGDFTDRMERVYNFTLEMHKIRLPFLVFYLTYVCVVGVSRLNY